MRSSFGESDGNDVLELFELWRCRYCVGLAGSAEGKRLWIVTSEYSIVTPLSNARASALREAHQLTHRTADVRQWVGTARRRQHRIACAKPP